MYHHDEMTAQLRTYHGVEDPYPMVALGRKRSGPSLLSTSGPDSLRDRLSFLQS